MEKENKKNYSLLESAISDYNEIMNAAKNNVAEKLSKEFPEKFESILKEELNKNLKYKKINDNAKDNSKEKKEPVMENKKELKKEDETKKSEDKDVKKVDENIDTTGLDMENLDSAIENLSDDDEVVTMDEIKKEISEMEKLKSELEEKKEDKLDDPTIDEKLKALDEKLNEVMKRMGEIVKPKIDEETEEDFELEKLGEEEEISDEFITDEDIDEIINSLETEENEDLESEQEDEVDEGMGISHASSKTVGGDSVPGEDFAKHRHKRYGSFNNESLEKKFNSIFELNKKLTKRVNEYKKERKTITEQLDNYKSALTKYRDQLLEMTVLNTNMANVNNLFVDESFDLSQEDKIKIINDFKRIDSISESENKYKSLLKEIKERENLSESVEKKLNASISPSSNSKLDEVVEKTAYKNDSINKIKERIKYMNNRK